MHWQDTLWGTGKLKVDRASNKLLSLPHLLTRKLFAVSCFMLLIQSRFDSKIRTRQSNNFVTNLSM